MERDQGGCGSGQGGNSGGGGMARFWVHFGGRSPRSRRWSRYKVRRRAVSTSAPGSLTGVSEQREAMGEQAWEVTSGLSVGRGSRSYCWSSRDHVRQAAGCGSLEVHGRGLGWRHTCGHQQQESGCQVQCLAPSKPLMTSGSCGTVSIGQRQKQNPFWERD